MEAYIARHSDGWDHTATMIASIANMLSGKRGKTIKPEDIHPHRLADRKTRRRERKARRSGRGSHKP